MGMKVAGLTSVTAAPGSKSRSMVMAIIFKEGGGSNTNARGRIGVQCDATHKMPVDFTLDEGTQRLEILVRAKSKASARRSTVGKQISVFSSLLHDSGGCTQKID